MPDATVNDIIETVAVCVCDNIPAFNVGHFVVSATTGAPVDYQDVVEALDAHWEDEYKTLMSHEANFIGTAMRRIVTDPTDYYTTNGNLGAGTQMTDVLPFQTAGLFRLRSGAAGRANRGRKYVPFPYEGASDDEGTPNATYLTNLGLLAAKYTGPQTLTIGGSTVTLSGIIFRKATSSFVLIASYLVVGEWATMRSRSKQKLVPSPVAY